MLANIEQIKYQTDVKQSSVITKTLFAMKNRINI